VTLKEGAEVPNGKIGDHPLTDILVHGRDVYGPRISALVREIAALADEKTRRELGDRLFSQYNEYSKPNVAELERELVDLRDNLQRTARDRGYEVRGE
jgi:hypothetical protein